jgi:hypothetical protein
MVCKKATGVDTCFVCGIEGNNACQSATGYYYLLLVVDRTGLYFFSTSCRVVQETHIIMEFCDRGSLQDAIKHNTFNLSDSAAKERYRIVYFTLAALSRVKYTLETNALSICCAHVTEPALAQSSSSQVCMVVIALILLQFYLFVTQTHTCVHAPFIPVLIS